MSDEMSPVEEMPSALMVAFAKKCKLDIVDQLIPIIPKSACLKLELDWRVPAPGVFFCDILLVALT